MLSDDALDTLFRTARTYREWRPGAVGAGLLQQVYDLAKMGPTSANCCPARFVFLVSQPAKERLLPHLAHGNVEKSRTAAAVALVAFDDRFWEQYPRLNDYGDMRTVYSSDERLAAETAFRNGSLQGAYFILAARACGLDCGPMSGFNADGVNREFFTGTSWRINFVCNLGYGEPAHLFPRQPRLDFTEACQVL